MLDDHNDRDLGLVGRRIGGEEGVVPVADRDLVVLEVLHEIEAHDLGGSGLAGHRHPRHPGAGARAAGLLHHSHEGARDDGQDVLGDSRLQGLRRANGRDFGAVPALETAQQTRLHAGASVRNHREGDGQLSGGHEVRALADRDGDRLTPLPWLLLHSQLPLSRGNEPGLLSGQVNARQLGQPEGLRVARDALDAEGEAQLVEIDVTGAHEGQVEIDRSVAAALPAAVRATSQPVVAGTEDLVSGIDHALGEASHRHDGLEGRARGVLPGDRAILQRYPLVADQAAPDLGVDAAREVVRVVGGPRDQRQDLAVARIEGHERTHLLGLFRVQGLEALLGDALQVEVDVQDRAAPGRRRNLVDLPHLAPRHVDDHVAAARTSAQVILEARLEADLTNDRARFVVGEAFLTQLPLLDLADRAQQVRAEGRLQIVPTRPHVGHHAVHRKAVRLDPGEALLAHVAVELDGLEATASGGMAYRGGELVRIPVEQLGQRLERLHGGPQLVGNHLDPIGRSIGSDHPALAIQDLAARRLEHQSPNRVPQRAVAKVRPFEDLQLKEADRKDRKCEADHYRDEAEPAVA